MVLNVRNDPERPAGGHAVLEGPGLDGVASLSFENLYSGLFLGADGRWAKRAHAFPVLPVPGDPGTLRLGPEIVDAVPAELQLALRSGEGRELGRLVWTDIVPSRSRAAPAPPPPDSAKTPAAPEPLRPEPPSPPPPALAVAPSAAPPTRSRAQSWVLPALAVLAAFAGAGAYALLRRPSPSDAVADTACDAFGQRAAALRDAPDDDRVTLAGQALTAGCGQQAFTTLDAADWEASEPAAWYLARFYDPNETGPAFRRAAAVHPAWAAAYYARWAPRSPRQAAALKALCGAAREGDPSLKRACAP